MTGTVAAFALVVLVAVISPGPDLVVVLRNAAAAGFRGGAATALGVGLGVVAWVVATGLGLAALVAASRALFTGVLLLGAAYLVWLGARAVWGAWRPAETARPGPEQTLAPSQGVAAAFWQGLACNVLNPKAAVFFVALMPQFVGADPDLPQVVLLSVVAGLVTVAWFVAVAGMVSRVRQLLARPAVQRAVGTVTGLVLIILGINVVLGI
ncbi:LysE family translocator [Antribacter gilvus]|uniref:LysE family translocator n=1 Tax=Antribacter gilvus TaxID=2304675 RepID=UPI0013DEE679|nr:LysE family transporter [Antribacter gilvus]